MSSRFRFELYPESSGKPPRDLGFVSDGAAVALLGGEGLR